MPSDRINELKQLAASGYPAYLQSEHWLTLRHAALQRGGFACALCAAKDALQVHHRSYERLGEEPDADLIVLCDGCHRHHHFGTRGEIERALSDAEIEEFMFAHGNRVIDKSEAGEKLTADEWVAFIWATTEIRTFTKIAEYTRVATGEKEIRAAWLSPDEVITAGSPWLSKCYVAMFDWIVPDLRDALLEKWWLSQVRK